MLIFPRNLLNAKVGSCAVRNAVDNKIKLLTGALNMILLHFYSQFFNKLVIIDIFYFSENFNVIFLF
jgi:hypothetical protein